MRKQLYFAHPRKTYDTEQEKQALKRIVQVFTGCKIINPSEPKFQKKMEEQVESYMSAHEYITPFLM